ncbi:phage tail protein [Amycolatopsis kentuckyensis]|uniref:phage tail protein n=1 Tax=Amycolatopsis kentuckyensis TaxID=218823 RepID=UPI00356145EC
MPTRRDKAPREPSAQPVRAAGPARRATPPALLRLQASAGNAAVSGLVALQRQGCPAPPVAPAGVTPAADPKFQSLTKDVGAQAKSAKAHPPAGAEVKKAQDAAVAPADDKDAQAKAAQADKMAAAKPAGFDKAAFIAAVNAAIAKQAPKNLDEAEKFASSGKADQVKAEVLGKVTSGKDASAKDVTDRTKEAPDPSRAVEKPVTPLPPAPAPPALAPPDPRKATPDKAPPEQTDLRADQCETHGAMAAAGVTDEQLAQSNEPEFTGALAAKQEGEQHTASAPAAVRSSEAGQLAAVTGAAQASGQAAVAGMTGARSSSAQRGQAAKSATKTKDEQDRARITGEIKAIFDETKTKVEGVLGALDDQVAKKFEAGEAQAKAAFTADHQARMKRYKNERYDGITGAARWAYDLFADLPAEANNLFLEAKKVYEVKMQGVIGEIADFVGQKLGEAKQLIADGRSRVKQKVESQSPALRKIAGEAAKEFGGQFDDLEKSVDEKQQALVEDLAQKYTEARNAVDEEIKALQAENKGLWSKAKEAVGGAIETILSLKNMLLGVLSRAANAVELIIRKPIEFLGNLVNAVKTGVMNFGANIVQHLKDGLKGWLLGNLASAGIEIPEALDAKGILKMVLSILGLTWASVRARILRFIPEPVLAKLEQTLDVVKILITEGVPGLWRWVVEKLGDLKELVLGQIKEFVIEKIVKAGITWIISLLNPAAAFIKACKAIYDIVMFFVEKAAQIKEFVDSVLDSVESIARGGAGAVAGLIERTLAKALPMVLGFLASLLGLGGISEKIKSVLEKVQAPVGKVIDSVVGTVVKAGKKVWSKLKGVGRKAKDKVASLFAPVKKIIGMKGASHELTAAPGPPFQLTMASNNPGRMVSRIDFAAAQLRRRAPQAIEQLGELAKLREYAILVEKTGARAERGDNNAAKRLETQLAQLGAMVVEYATRFNAHDLDELNPADDVEMTLRLANAAADKKRLGSVDLALIRMQIERHLGPAWRTFVGTLGPNIWTLSRESLLAVYGREEGTRLINHRDRPLEGNGLYDGRRNQMFVKMGRSINEVASSIIHEGTHSLQEQFGGNLARFEKEFQAFSVQRNFLLRLSPAARERVARDKNYGKLLDADTDEKMRQLVEGKYGYEVKGLLDQRANVQLVKRLVKREFGE